MRIWRSVHHTVFSCDVPDCVLSVLICVFTNTLCFIALLMFGAALKWCTRSLFPMPASLFGKISKQGHFMGNSESSWDAPSV